MPAVEPHFIEVRIEGGGGASTIDYGAGERGAETENEGPATFVAGRSAASVRLTRGLHAFGGTHLYRVAFDEEKLESVEGTLIARSNPYHQLGDAAAGVRGYYARSRAVHMGVELGVLLLGKAGSEAGTVILGPETGATSPFGRLLFTWKTDVLSVSANAGAIHDQSWRIWESAEITEGAVPYQHERVALSIYGSEGPVTRLLGGAQVAFDAGRFHPFAEFTAESTESDLTWRMTPGIAFQATESLRLFLSADIGAASSVEASPQSAPFRANAGLALRLGSPPPPSRQRSPQPQRRTQVVVRVVRESGNESIPVAGAQIGLFHGPDLVGKPERSNADGYATLLIPEKDQNLSSLLVKARAVRGPDGHYTLAPVTESTSIGPRETKVVMTDRFVTMRVKVMEGPNTEWNGQTAVLLFNKSMRKLEVNREMTHLLPPGPPPLVELGLAKRVVTLPIRPAPGQAFENIVVYTDRELSCLDLKPCGSGAVAMATPAPTPAATPVLAEERIVAFDPDSADVKPEAGKTLVERVSAAGGPVTITVHVDKGTDPIFLEAITQSRVEALATFLKSKGLNATQFEVVRKLDAESDYVTVRGR